MTTPREDYLLDRIDELERRLHTLSRWRQDMVVHLAKFREPQVDFDQVLIDQLNTEKQRTNALTLENKRLRALLVGEVTREEGSPLEDPGRARLDVA